MGLYLYCIGGADQPDPDDVPGVDDVRVRVVPLGELRAWVSELDRAPTASLERVRAHNQVVEAASRERTPLPVRFGQWFESEAELEEALRERLDPLREGLERVQGALEYGVRLLEPGHAQAAPPDRTTGRAYLESLARRQHEGEAWRDRLMSLARELRAQLGDSIRDQRADTGGPGELVVAHLVDRHDTGTYAARLRTFKKRYPEMQLVSSGPWPPYGFTDEA